MNKEMLIDSILKLDARSAFNYEGGWVDARMRYTYQYRKYVNYSETVIGDTGGPSRAIIKDIHCSWNRNALLTATNKELIELKKATKRTYKAWKRIYDKYSKPMTMVEFFRSFSNHDNGQL